MYTKDQKLTRSVTFMVPYNEKVLTFTSKDDFHYETQDGGKTFTKVNGPSKIMLDAEGIRPIIYTVNGIECIKVRYEKDTVINDVFLADYDAHKALYKTAPSE